MVISRIQRYPERTQRLCVYFLDAGDGGKVDYAKSARQTQWTQEKYATNATKRRNGQKRCLLLFYVWCVRCLALDRSHRLPYSLTPLTSGVGVEPGCSTNFGAFRAKTRSLALYTSVCYEWLLKQYQFVFVLKCTSDRNLDKTYWDKPQISKKTNGKKIFWRIWSCSNPTSDFLTQNMP